jgi:arylsulfatase I/J
VDVAGGKYSDFNGGIMSAAFVSGGYLPPAVRGTSFGGLISIADWYSTFCSLAGVDVFDPVAAAAHLPQPDGLDMSAVILGVNATSPRTEIFVSNATLISWPFKLVTGTMGPAGWQGPVYPNATSNASSPNYYTPCGSGCLFNIVDDVTEHMDLAAANPAIVANMTSRLTDLRRTLFSNNDTGVNIPQCPDDSSMPCACWAAINVWGGFFGWYQTS